MHVTPSVDHRGVLEPSKSRVLSLNKFLRVLLTMVLPTYQSTHVLPMCLHTHVSQVCQHTYFVSAHTSHFVVELCTQSVSRADWTTLRCRALLAYADWLSLQQRALLIFLTNYIKRPLITTIKFLEGFENISDTSKQFQKSRNNETRENTCLF